MMISSITSVLYNFADICFSSVWFLCQNKEVFSAVYWKFTSMTSSSIKMDEVI